MLRHPKVFWIDTIPETQPTVGEESGEKAAAVSRKQNRRINKPWQDMLDDSCSWDHVQGFIKSC